MPVAAYLQLVRAPALFSAASNILAAQLIVTQGEPQWFWLLMLVTVSLCLYAGGMALNDYFDVEQDRRERAARPIPSGRIARKQALRLVWGLFALALITSAALGKVQLIIVLALICLIWLYDGAAKDRPLGSGVMALCRYLNWLLGLSTGAFNAEIFLLPLPVFLYIAALTELSRHETGSRELRLPLPVSMALGAAVTVFLALIVLTVLPNSWVLAVFLLAALPLVVRLWRLNRNWTPAGIERTVAWMILGIIPLDACLAWAAGPWWSGCVVLLFLLPARLLARSLYLT
ncbi:MAG: UbiA family prenyltransferase [Chromatiaceae bacterium]|nr:UbiA family prenyltransferase [Chromatiaceae bacterium]